MRLCRFKHNGQEALGFYDERRVVPLAGVARIHATATGQSLDLPSSAALLDFLPHGKGFGPANKLAQWLPQADEPRIKTVALATNEVELLVPIPRPNKIFLLAGNYAKHIEEGGGIAAERKETFPYVFMKPPTTTLTDPGRPIVIPAVSPQHIDWELELAVIIGQRIKGIREADALKAVAGYTVINDISDRKFKPNPDRKPREKDKFFDWLHGKWHDSFCPCGPCVLSADAVPDPQHFDLTLKLNSQVRQQSSTAFQIFPVAAVIEFIASFVTLEPGDMISTGTPDGVGNTTGTYLKPGDVLEAGISSIGTLVTPVSAG